MTAITVKTACNIAYSFSCKTNCRFDVVIERMKRRTDMKKMKIIIGFVGAMVLAAPAFAQQTQIVVSPTTTSTVTQLISDATSEAATSGRRE